MASKTALSRITDQSGLPKTPLKVPHLHSCKRGWTNIGHCIVSLDPQLASMKTYIKSATTILPFSSTQSNPSKHTPDWIARGFIFLAQLYRWTLSPLKTTFLGPAARCRFHPSCSQYAIDSWRFYGGYHGSIFALRRIVRCHPWGGSGYDPVPEKLATSQVHKEKP